MSAWALQGWVLLALARLGRVRQGKHRHGQNHRASEMVRGILASKGGIRRGGEWTALVRLGGSGSDVERTGEPSRGLPRPETRRIRKSAPTSGLVRLWKCRVWLGMDGSGAVRLGRVRHDAVRRG
jgi:hypothetical protein